MPPSLLGVGFCFCHSISLFVIFVVIIAEMAITTTTTTTTATTATSTARVVVRHWLPQLIAVRKQTWKEKEAAHVLFVEKCIANYLSHTNTHTHTHTRLPSIFSQSSTSFIAFFYDR